MREISGSHSTIRWVVRTTAIAYQRRQPTDMTPYLKWREKNVSLYEVMYDTNLMSRMRMVFPPIRDMMSRILGLHTKDVRIRMIGGVISIYVPTDKWKNRRTDDISLNTKRNYSNYLNGAIDQVFHLKVKAR